MKYVQVIGDKKPWFEANQQQSACKSAPRSAIFEVIVVAKSITSKANHDPQKQTYLKQQKLNDSYC